MGCSPPLSLMCLPVEVLSVIADYPYVPWETSPYDKPTDLASFNRTCAYEASVDALFRYVTLPEGYPLTTLEKHFKRVREMHFVGRPRSRLRGESASTTEAWFKMDEAVHVELASKDSPGVNVRILAGRKYKMQPRTGWPRISNMYIQAAGPTTIKHISPLPYDAPPSDVTIAIPMFYPQPLAFPVHHRLLSRAAASTLLPPTDDTSSSGAWSANGLRLAKQRRGTSTLTVSQFNMDKVTLPDALHPLAKHVALETIGPSAIGFTDLEWRIILHGSYGQPVPDYHNQDPDVHSAAMELLRAMSDAVHREVYTGTLVRYSIHLVLGTIADAINIALTAPLGYYEVLRSGPSGAHTLWSHEMSRADQAKMTVAGIDRQIRAREERLSQKRKEQVVKDRGDT